MPFRIKANPFTPSFKISFEIDLFDIVRNTALPLIFGFQFGVSGGHIFKIIIAGRNAFIELAEYAVCRIVNKYFKQLFDAVQGDDDPIKSDYERKKLLSRSVEFLKIIATTGGIIGMAQLVSDPIYCSNGLPFLMLAFAITVIATSILPSKIDQPNLSERKSYSKICFQRRKA